ncbi:hypothetical protein D3C75_1119260 [compost metagenome]
MAGKYSDFLIQPVQFVPYGIDEIPFPSTRQIGASDPQFKEHIPGKEITAAKEADTARRMSRRMHHTKGESQQLKHLSFCQIKLCRFCADRRCDIRPHQRAIQLGAAKPFALQSV